MLSQRAVLMATKMIFVISESATSSDVSTLIGVMSFTSLVTQHKICHKKSTSSATLLIYRQFR